MPNNSARNLRTLDDIADDYSLRARAARITQGKKPVLKDVPTLMKLAAVMAAHDASLVTPKTSAA